MKYATLTFKLLAQHKCETRSSLVAK